MSEPREIQIPERGSVRIGTNIWKELAATEEFWSLVDNNVLRVDVRGREGVFLNGTCYVGKAIIANQRLSFTEKVPGAFVSLSRLAWPESPKLVNVRSAIGEEDRTFSILCRIFAQKAEEFVIGHRQAEYKMTRGYGSMIGGKLDLPNTIRLRARGIRHQVAFMRTEVSHETDRNLIVAAALKKLEGLSKDVAIDSDILVLARKLSMAFTECRVRLSFLTYQELDRIIDEQAARLIGEAKVVQDVIELSVAIIKGVGFGANDLNRQRISRSWFINLETLFERAIGRVLAENFSGNAIVERPRCTPSVLPDCNNRYPANTDFVVESRNGISIVDAKYKVKDYNAWPSSAEVHEVSAHASAFSAAHAFLVYPADNYWRRRVGTDRHGCAIWAMGVNLLNIESDLCNAFENIILPKTNYLPKENKFAGCAV